VGQPSIRGNTMLFLSSLSGHEAESEPERVLEISLDTPVSPLMLVKKPS
jgi:hypothetical protein